METPTAQRVWDWLGAGLTEVDGGVFADLVNVATAPLAEVEAAGRAVDGRPGWAAVFDPDTCPDYALVWLAQLVGVKLDQRLSVPAQRAQIRERPYIRRGQPESIRGAARPWLLSGDVTLIERDGGAYLLTVQYDAAQVGGIGSYADSAAAFATYADLYLSLKRYADTTGDRDRMQAAVLAAVPVGVVTTFDEIP